MSIVPVGGIGSRLAQKFHPTTARAPGSVPSNVSSIAGNLKPTSVAGMSANQPVQPVLINQSMPQKVAYQPPPSAAPANPETVPQAASPTLPTLGAGAAEVIYRATVSGSAVTPITIPTTNDYKTLIIRMDVSATSGTTAIPATDILNALSNLSLDDPSGQIVNLTPVDDFYPFYLRYSRYHSALTKTTLTGTASTQVTVSATYELPGFRLSQSGGPYTLNLTTPSASTFSSDCTALSTLFTVSVVPGLTGGVTVHAINSTLNPQPVASGYTDYAPTFPFQGQALDELYFSGLTSNTADVEFWSITLNGQLVSNRIYSSELVAQAQGRMTGTIPSSNLFLCYGLNTQIALNRSSHLWASFGSSPATSGVTATAVWYA